MFTSDQFLSSFAQVFSEFSAREAACEKALPWLEPKSDSVKAIVSQAGKAVLISCPAFAKQWQFHEINSEFYNLRFLLYLIYNALDTGSSRFIDAAFQRKMCSLHLDLIECYAEALRNIRDHLIPSDFSAETTEEVKLVFDHLIEVVQSQRGDR